MNERARSAVLGALIADAASLGTHWIYDVARVREVGGATPEFLEPRLENYRNTQAYFAHAGKRSGDLTHYGEQLMVALRAHARSGGPFDAVAFEKEFVAAFGPGGTWIGYIDFATRETLYNIERLRRASLDAARAIDLGEFEKDRSLMEAKVMVNVRIASGAQLDAAMAKAVGITHPGNEVLTALGQKMAQAVSRARGGARGADDTQLPAVSRLPALLASGADDAVVERVVRATNDNDDAVAWAQPIWRALQHAAAGATPREAVARAAASSEGVVGQTLVDALACASAEEAAAQYGRACPLPQSAPVIFAVATHAPDFEAAVRDNVWAAGDNAGRAVILGALYTADACPDAWKQRVPALQEAEALLARF